MEAAEILNFVGALIFVLALIGGLAWLVARSGLPQGRFRFGKRDGNQRLEIIETLSLDPRRRLVLVRQDDKEHLLLLGINGDIVVSEGLGKENFQDFLIDEEPDP